MITTAIDLQMTPGSIPPLAHVSQYETGGRMFAFHLWDKEQAFAISSGCAATLYGRRPDGVGFSEACTISNDTLTVTVTSDMTACAGRVECEIELATGNTRISTENFYLLVERAAYRLEES